MPLSPDDREDYRRDGRDLLRREGFRAVRRSPVSMTLEEYLQWLNDLQRLFPFRPPSLRPVPTRLNRL